MKNLNTYKDYLKENALFTIDNIEDAKSKMQKNIKAPYVMVSHSTLGGDERISILLKISLDDQKTWANGIFQNSKFFQIRYDSTDSKLELFTKHFSITQKFRKTKTKSVEDAISKINKYIGIIK